MKMLLTLAITILMSGAGWLPLERHICSSMGATSWQLVDAHCASEDGCDDNCCTEESIFLGIASLKLNGFDSSVNNIVVALLSSRVALYIIQPPTLANTDYPPPTDPPPVAKSRPYLQVFRL